jgi:signal transduction histidine kinase/ActR/RegA family two-component response regulator
MNPIQKLNDICASRIEKFGAQYTTFAIFGIINYPAAMLYEYVSDNYHGILIRILATILCIGLLLRSYAPKNIQKYIPLYWYILLTASIPFLASYLLLKNNLSLAWLINFNTGTIITILILDIASFITIQFIGTFLGVAVFYLLGNETPRFSTNEDAYIFLYVFFWTTVLGSIFSRNREIFNEAIQSRLEKEVASRTTELKNALSFKTEYLNNISHDIRTPIHGFWNFSNILVEKWQELDESKRFEIASQIAKNSARLKNMISNLLDLSKHSAGKWVVAREVFDLGDLVSDIVDEMRNLYIIPSGKNVYIAWSTQGKKFEIFADKELISQVLRNLFSNGIKFSPEGGKLIAELNFLNENEVENLGIQALPGKSFVHFSLKDEGVGIPKQEIDKIFDPFIQSSFTNAKSGGTGLGLAICKNVIELHEGKIYAENNANVIGATFHFIIPTGRTADKSRDTVKQLDDKDDILLNNHNLSDDKKVIVIIDDESSVSMATSIILESAGYNTKAFLSATEGLDFVRQNPGMINLVLLDLMMPDISGFDALEILKEDGYLEKIPVIMQSGISRDSEVEKAISMGARYFLKKPYSKDYMIQIIGNVLSQKKDVTTTS